MSFIKNHKILDFIEKNKLEILSWYDSIDLTNNDFIDIRLDHRDLKSLNDNISTNTLTKESAPNFWLHYNIYPLQYCFSKNKSFLENLFKISNLKTIDNNDIKINWLKELLYSVENIIQISILRLYNNKDVMILHSHINDLQATNEKYFFHLCLKNTINYEDSYFMLAKDNEKINYKRGVCFGFDPKEMHGAANISEKPNDYRDVLLIADIDDIENVEKHYNSYIKYLEK